MIVNNTREILEKFDIWAKKSYGQNFLIKEHIINEIIIKSNVTKESNVIEIGPGIGALTEALSLNANKVLCYEIDTKMIEVLKHTLSQYSNVVVKNIDILKADIEKDINENFSDSSDIKVVANLPYYITTPIIFKLLEIEEIKNITIMVQKEVGQRLTGKPNTKDYNALSVLMQYKTDSRIVGNVSRKCFIPEPNVDSVLLNIRVVKNDYGVKNEQKFLEFIQVIFAQRRKTLINNISNFYLKDKGEIGNILRKLGMIASIRAEALDIFEIVQLYKEMFE